MNKKIKVLMATILVSVFVVTVFGTIYLQDDFSGDINTNWFIGGNCGAWAIGGEAKQTGALWLAGYAWEADIIMGGSVCCYTKTKYEIPKGTTIKIDLETNPAMHAELCISNEDYENFHKYTLRVFQYSDMSHASWHEEYIRLESWKGNSRLDYEYIDYNTGTMEIWRDGDDKIHFKFGDTELATDDWDWGDEEFYIIFGTQSGVCQTALCPPYSHHATIWYIWYAGDTYWDNFSFYDH